MPKRRISLLLIPVAAAVVAAALAGAATPARASETLECSGCQAWWRLSSSSLPAHLPPGGEGQVSVLAENRGDANANGTVVLTDKLPSSLTAKSVEFGFGQFEPLQSLGEVLCTVQPKEVTCTVPAEFNTGSFALTSYTRMEAYIKVEVAGSANASEESTVTVSGGAPSVSVTRPIAVAGSLKEPTPFGVEQYELRPENADGSPDTQAGSHPFQLTTVLNLNQSSFGFEPPAAVKDLRFNLPPGLVGNPTPFPQCALSKFLANGPQGQDFCPDNTVVGVASVTIEGYRGSSPGSIPVPLFALVPSTGEPARFGFYVEGVPVYLDTSVRTGSDYGVTVTVPNITEFTGFISSRVTFWGVPGDPRHDAVRGWNCIAPVEGFSPPCAATNQPKPPPLLTLPTACTGPVQTSMEADSWEKEGEFVPPFSYTFRDNVGRPVGMDGCNQEPFAPSIDVTPDGQAASTPTGLTVDEHVPQETDLNGAGLAESAVKGLSVTLPEGVALNPAAADGLGACSLEQIGLQNAEPPSCAEASKVATVRIRTPLLPNLLEGAAYLATQNSNPFGSLVAMYIYATDPVSGISAKAAGQVLENPVTGQLTAHFEEDPLFSHDPRYANYPEADFLPEVPFEDIEVHFFGGDRAPLSTPAHCGAYTSTGTFTPWSESATVASSSTFNVTSGPNGGACSSSLPFSPELAAGDPSIQAGGFSPFTLTMSRSDGNQNLDAIQLHMPPGLSGMLTGIPLCGETQANAGLCPAASQIGETTISVGLGGDPFTVQGGRVYITGPYRGAPYGLAIVNPAKAGPFDVERDSSKQNEYMPACDCVVVRAKIEIDPTTAAITVTSDTSGPYRIPTILDGIPLQIKHVNVTINRPSFIFNPTNCGKMAITGALTSAEGAVDSLSVPFQVTNCATLAFKPQFAVATSAHHTRTGGESLHVKLTYPKAPFGSQANIAKVRVELPKQLPSRLTTLQKACTDTVFNQSPANCPAASKIGEATATTPIIPEDFHGPAYFVSHGGAKFPELIIVLHGYALTVDLHGETFISKEGVTSTTFNTVPDVPIGSFELNLPAGPDSALAANGDLCASKLQMPTTFTAQNGALIKQATPIAVQGCAPEIRVIRHAVRGKHATVVVSVPSAGRLVAGGGGLSRVSRTVRGAGTVTVTLMLSRQDQRFVARHNGRRLMAPIRLSFTPAHGRPLQARVAVLMR